MGDAVSGPFGSLSAFYCVTLAQLRAYLRLMRVDRPIGCWLLLWPTLWALWLAAEGWPPRRWLLLFILGVFIMRSAGCVLNDYADRHIDGLVPRTRQRPLPQGEVTGRECLLLFLALLSAAGLLLLAFDRATIQLAGVALLLTAVYPWAKRVTSLPQLVLALAFAWSIPMVFSAVTQQLPARCWLLLLATGCWVTAYDTQYALVDCEADRRIGVQSTAVRWGHKSASMIGRLQCAMLGCLGSYGWLQQLGGAFYGGLLAAALLFVYQYRLLARQQADDYFKAFSNNQYVGGVIFIGIALGLK